MTTTDAAKLREAAQRLFSADSDYWFTIFHSPVPARGVQPRPTANSREEVRDVNS